MNFERMLVVDTSVFVTSMFPHEPYYAVSKNFFDLLLQEKISVFIPMITVLEILQVFFRLTGDSQKTDELFEEILEANMAKMLQIMNLEASFLEHFVAFQQDFSLKTADTIAALTAHRYEYALITWDKKMIKACRKKVRAFNPVDFLKKYRQQKEKFFSKHMPSTPPN